jgi:hypothetical protein
MTKIQLKNINHGFKMQNLCGFHRSPGNDAGKVKMGYEKTAKSKLSRETVEDCVFAAENTDRRGKRSKLEFRNNSPVRWNPTKDFRKEDSGDSQGGAFKSGRDGNKAGGRRDYAQAFGNVKNNVSFGATSQPNHIKIR